MEVLWNETGRGKWQSLMDRSGAPFQQSWTYGEVARVLGATVHRIEIRDNGKIVALAQGVERRFLRPFTLFTMGPVWIDAPDDGTRISALQALRARIKGTVISTAPGEDDRASFERAGLKDVMTPAVLADLDLSDGFHDRMSAKWRNRLVTAQKLGLKVLRNCDPVQLNWLLAVDQQQQKTRKFRNLPAAFTQTWREADRKSVALHSIVNGNTPIAAMLFLRHGSTATYHIGWSGDEGRACSAHNLILDDAATHFARKGVKRINLGLIDTETTPGLARFKLGAGARPVKTGGTWLGW